MPNVDRYHQAQDRSDSRLFMLSLAWMVAVTGLLVLVVDLALL
jgi:hypothetical protein